MFHLLTVSFSNVFNIFLLWNVQKVAGFGYIFPGVKFFLIEE